MPIKKKKNWVQNTLPRPSSRKIESLGNSCSRRSSTFPPTYFLRLYITEKIIKACVVLLCFSIYLLVVVMSPLFPKFLFLFLVVYCLFRLDVVNWVFFWWFFRFCSYIMFLVFVFCCGCVFKSWSEWFQVVQGGILVVCPGAFPESFHSVLLVMYL